MAVQPVATPTVGVSPQAVTEVKPQSKSAQPTPAQATLVQAPDSVTISKHATRAAAASGQISHIVATGAAQTSTSAYVLKVRAALANNGNASVQQIMARLGVPQAEQQQILTALGGSPAKTTSK
ncbi:MAG TPA: hypothetical protein VNL71_02995 [Chloroflexota bacterium]|nr:hypothetical protein [Chloroflexota bacterium]